MKPIDKTEEHLWRERQEVVEPKEFDDPFIPAREAKPFDPKTEELVVRVEL